jgi:hypothetical protein
MILAAFTEKKLRPRSFVLQLPSFDFQTLSLLPSIKASSVPSEQSVPFLHLGTHR